MVQSRMQFFLIPILFLCACGPAAPKSDLTSTGNGAVPDALTNYGQFQGIGKETTRPSLDSAATADGRTIYLPLQAPTGVHFDGELFGIVVEQDGCIYISRDGKIAGGLIIWPHDSQLKIDGDQIAVINRYNQVVARVGEMLHGGGGQLSSPNFNRESADIVPGLSKDRCPSTHYQILAPLEPLEQQAANDSS